MLEKIAEQLYALQQQRLEQVRQTLELLAALDDDLEDEEPEPVQKRKIGFLST